MMLFQLLSFWTFNHENAEPQEIFHTVSVGTNVLVSFLIILHALYKTICVILLNFFAVDCVNLQLSEEFHPLCCKVHDVVYSILRFFFVFEGRQLPYFFLSPWQFEHSD